MLREASKIIHLEPSDSPLRYAHLPAKSCLNHGTIFRTQFVAISQEESDLEGYIEMVENIA